MQIRYDEKEDKFFKVNDNIRDVHIPYVSRKWLRKNPNKIAFVKNESVVYMDELDSKIL